MSEGDVLLFTLHGMVSQMEEGERAMVEELAGQFRRILEGDPAAVIAFAIVSAELARKE